MLTIRELLDGYRRFRGETYAVHKARYDALAREGQSPKVMVIACCDSRADPATIFDAAPGALFVVRNVANLVPPHEPLGDYHGTSAALEFAVTGLEVAHIVVLGHARCGGVAACLKGRYDMDAGGRFITKWIALLKGPRGEVLRAHGDAPEAAQQQALEQAGIAHSLDNLLTFPFVQAAVEAGRLTLHGAYFDIATGELMARDPESGTFVSVE